MRGKLRRVPARLAVVLATVAVVAAAGVSYAATALTSATANDPLVVCVNNTNGEMRAVSGASACRTNESSLELARATGPQSVTVDCAAGQKVGDVLAAADSSPSRLTITVNGVCKEEVIIRRDRVAIAGGSPGSGFEAPGSGSIVVGLRGASRITLSQLKITGGSVGISAGAGSAFSAFNVEILDARIGISVGSSSTGNVSNSTVDRASDRGVEARLAGSITFFGGRISDSGTFGVTGSDGGDVQLGGGAIVASSGFHGVMASEGGSVLLDGATVRNSGGTGAFAWKSGTVTVRGSGTLVETSRQTGVGANQGAVEISNGARIANNQRGGVGAFNGGSIVLQHGPVIENNTGSGVRLSTGSAGAFQDGTIIRNNTGDGITLHDTSVMSRGGGATNQIVNNGGWGIRCDPAPAVAQLTGGPASGTTVSGNTAGQINCPTAEPPFVTVDCAAGQTIAQALSKAPASGTYTITIRGTCIESVRVDRDNVTLRASAAGDGIQAPASAFTALFADGVRHLHVDQLTLTGGQNGLSATRGAIVTANGLRVVDAGNTGVFVGGNAHVQLNNATVENAGQNGVQSNGGGFLSLNGGTISNTGTFGVGAQNGGVVTIGGGTVIRGTRFIGVYAAFSGSVDISGATVEDGNTGMMANQGGTIHANAGRGPILIRNNAQHGVAVNNGGSAAVSNGVRVTNNAFGGIIVFNTGALQLEGSFVENNGNAGVNLTGASSAQIQNSTISGNSGNGIHVSDTSVVQIGLPGGNTITGNAGWGIFCQPHPANAMMMGSPGTVSGNTAGAISCP